MPAAIRWVKDYVRLQRVRMKEAFVPLAHPPGHAQVDFGQCIGIIGGVRTVMHVRGRHSLRVGWSRLLSSSDPSQLCISLPPLG
jgi:hypothetical protein